jgi:hypothetical protein
MSRVRSETIVYRVRRDYWCDYGYFNPLSTPPGSYERRCLRRTDIRGRAEGIRGS